MYKVGFIGCGNMGGALALAAAKSISGKNILLSDHNSDKISQLSKQTGGKASSNAEIATSCKYIFLGVKPAMMAGMLKEISPVLKLRSDRFILVSMAASLKAADIEAMAGGNCPVLRIMPNTPCAVGKGILLYARSKAVTDTEISEFTQMMAQSGMTDSIPESLIDAASAISGCGPAFAYMFIEALADGGVLCGLPRDKAQSYAAQMVAGSAEMVLSSGKHPGMLKDAVCSPGGTTIAGVRALEKSAFRGAAMDSVISAYEKTIGKS